MKLGVLALIGVILSGCSEVREIGRMHNVLIISVPERVVYEKAAAYGIEPLPGARLLAVWCSTDRAWWRYADADGQHVFMVSYAGDRVAIADYLKEKAHD